MRRFKRLRRLLVLLKEDATIQMVPHPKWPPNAEDLERRCGALNARALDALPHSSYRHVRTDQGVLLFRNEYELLAQGEGTDVERLLRNKPALRRVYAFLCEAFDGDLQEVFYIYPEDEA